jgi:hypothetical protein
VAVPGGPRDRRAVGLAQWMSAGWGEAKRHHVGVSDASVAGSRGKGTVSFMSAQPDGSPELQYEVIHLGGEAAAIVPLAELRRLRAVERHASADALEEAEIEATLAGYREWVAAGRPGAVSHEEAAAELLRDVP